MIAKLTKEVTERLKAFQSLEAALAEQGPEVAEAVRGSAPPAPAPTPDPEADSSPGTVNTAVDDADVLGTINVCKQGLQGSINQAVAYDRDLFTLSSEEATQRKIRDTTMEFLGAQVVGLRRTTLGQYAEPDLTSLGLRPPNPSEPLAFLRNTELVTEQLRSADRLRMLGKPLFATAHDPGIHADDFDAPTLRLRGALNKLRALKRRIDSVLSKKQEILEDYDREELRLSRMFEDLCHFAGKPKLANRVRPTARRLQKKGGRAGLHRPDPRRRGSTRQGRERWRHAGEC
jgi:hypothetical protein